MGWPLTQQSVLSLLKRGERGVAVILFLSASEVRGRTFRRQRCFLESTSEPSRHVFRICNTVPSVGLCCESHPQVSVGKDLGVQGSRKIEANTTLE